MCIYICVYMCVYIYVKLQGSLLMSLLQVSCCCARTVFLLAQDRLKAYMLIQDVERMDTGTTVLGQGVDS